MNQISHDLIEKEITDAIHHAAKEVELIFEDAAAAVAELCEVLEELLPDQE